MRRNPKNSPNYLARDDCSRVISLWRKARLAEKQTTSSQLVALLSFKKVKQITRGENVFRHQNFLSQPSPIAQN